VDTTLCDPAQLATTKIYACILASAQIQSFTPYRLLHLLHAPPPRSSCPPPLLFLVHLWRSPSHARTHTRTRAYAHTCTHTCTYLYTHANALTHAHTYTHICSHMHTHAHTHAYKFGYTCVPPPATLSHCRALTPSASSRA